MGIREFFKAKTVGEYLEARKDSEKMKELSGRTWKDVAKNSVNATKERQEELKRKEMEKKAVKCPVCGTINVEFLQQDKKSFSAGKAIAGAALTGGIGTLAGFAGKKGKLQWHCKECGCLFETKKK